jgi:hypothetical protein
VKPAASSGITAARALGIVAIGASLAVAPTDGVPVWLSAALLTACVVPSVVVLVGTVRLAMVRRDRKRQELAEALRLRSLLAIVSDGG